MTSIQGSLHLDGVTALNKLSFSKLGQVGSLTLNAVPNLDTMDFTAGVSKAGTIDIQNTKLGSLQGISLVMVDTINIANNPYLTNVSMPLGNVTKSLTVSALTASLDVSLPNLIWASNLTFHNVSTVELPQLSSTNGSIGVYGLLNDTFAAPMLGDIGGALVLQDGTNIQNFNVPNVTQIGADFTIANCNKIGNITMPLLKKVGGAWDTHGNFSTYVLSSAFGALLTSPGCRRRRSTMLRALSTCSRRVTFSRRATRSTSRCRRASTSTASTSARAAWPRRVVLARRRR